MSLCRVVNKYYLVSGMWSAWWDQRVVNKHSSDKFAVFDKSCASFQPQTNGLVLEFLCDSLTHDSTQFC